MPQSTEATPTDAGAASAKDTNEPVGCPAQLAHGSEGFGGRK